MKLNPPSTLIIGPAGSGKTSVIVTALAAGLTVRMLATEPSAPNRVLEHAKKVNVNADKFDWCYVSPGGVSWDSLKAAATQVNTMTLKQIADQSSGIAKSDGTQWMKMLNAIADFKSDKTGQSLGDATEWGPDVMFVVDGLTGISTMSRRLTVGLKPTPSPGEWGIMQGNILDLIRKLCSDCKCFFTLIGHIERETNELTGGTNLTVSTLGAKLAPKLPPEFTNVVQALRNGTTFTWSTATAGVDTKAGDLPIQEGLAPSFAPIIASYRARAGITPTGTSSPQTPQVVPPAKL